METFPRRERKEPATLDTCHEEAWECIWQTKLDDFTRLVRMACLARGYHFSGQDPSTNGNSYVSLCKCFPLLGLSFPDMKSNDSP